MYKNMKLALDKVSHEELVALLKYVHNGVNSLPKDIKIRMEKYDVKDNPLEFGAKTIASLSSQMVIIAKLLRDSVFNVEGVEVLDSVVSYSLYEVYLYLSMNLSIYFMICSGVLSQDDIGLVSSLFAPVDEEMVSELLATQKKVGDATGLAVASQMNPEGLTKVVDSLKARVAETGK